jgi:cell division septation protein DedD
VCTKTTCSRIRPGPDGHVVTHTYDCVKCLPPPAKPEPAKPEPAKPAKPAPAKPAAATMNAEPGAPDAEPGHGRTPMIAGLGIGFLVLVGGVWFTRRRERPAP